MKEAPGALRDLMATRTIAALTDALLLQRGPADPGRFEEAEDFLLRVRSILHLEAERNQNMLSHELQERTADVLGYPGDEPRQRVERLMSDYFRHARTVSRTLEWMRRTAPTPVGPNLGLTRDGVRFLDPVQAARSPASWLAAFQAALDAGTGITDEALSCIQQHVSHYRAEDFTPEPRDRAAFLKLLKPRPGLYAALSQMHDCGLLGRLFPEFDAVSWRVVRDFYHKYTASTSTRCSRSGTSSGSSALRNSTASGSRRSRPVFRRPSCSCWRSFSTTSASGATTSMRSKACAWRPRRSSGCRLLLTRGTRCCS